MSQDATGYSKSEWITGAVVGVVMLVVLFGFFGGDGETDKEPMTAEERRTERVEQGFSAWNGSHRELTRWIKKNLKDPDSYEHIETKYVDEGGDEITVVTRYRARNSFGGMTVEAVVAKADIDGSIIEIVGHQ